MFCSNCGKEINDNQKFCRHCGTKNEIGNDLTSSSNEILNDIQSQQINTVFNRDVLNNYLYNVRVLEMYRNKLQKHINDLNYDISQLGNRKVGDDGCGSYTIEDILPALGCAGIGLVFGVIIGWLKNTGIANFFDIVGFLGGLSTFVIIVSILIAIGAIIWLVIMNVKDNNEYKINRENDIRRVEQEIIQKNNLIHQLNSSKKEMEKINTLLKEEYSLNIIPSKFRNIYAAYFLYDFISTSTASLNEALLHCDLDTIQEKLDTVIQQQEEIIMELAYQNALNEKIVRQNEQMLGHAIQTENNTALAAQYTRIAANNTNIVAAIQMSEYLRP